jgi:hypothetical protein
MTNPDTPRTTAPARVTNTDMRNMTYRAVRDYCECCVGSGSDQFPALSPNLFCEGFDEPPPNNQQFALVVGRDRFTVTITKNRGA